MKNTLLFLFFLLLAGSTSAQATLTVRVDSVAPKQWYFVRSRQTMMPDSTVVVDEQKQYFPSRAAIRKFVLESYQGEITRDSIEYVRLRNQVTANRNTRKTILLTIKP